MVDTIVLVLKDPEFRITDPDKFQPSARWALANNFKPIGIQSRQNPTKKELRNGLYKPRLTLSHRVNVRGRRETSLKIELSLPKLVFGNNFDELQYKDFFPVTRRLANVLKAMGVLVNQETLVHAPVCAIHYSKNIILTDGSTPYHYINKIKQANIKLSLDVNQTDYRNDGHSYKWHCNSYEVIFYDKIKDLEKAKQSSKRALEKDSDMQLHLFDRFKKRRKFEVLRMEVRLNKRQKIKQLFAKLNIKADLTFKKLFKPAISKKILLHYLAEIESKRPILLDYHAASDKALLATLIINNSDLSSAKILQLFGLKKALEVLNMRELRSMFAKKNQRSFSRIMADLKKVNLPNIKRPLGSIRRHIEIFKPVNLK